MPLLRGFSKVDPVEDPASNGADEGGAIAIPSNISSQIGLFPGSSASIKVVRIKNSGRWPCMIIHNSKVTPRLSMFQVVMMEGRAEIDDKARLILTNNILRELKLEPGYRVEIKLVGPNRASWAVIHNRGTNRLTTLQEKMGRQGRSRKKWKSMTVGY